MIFQNCSFQIVYIQIQSLYIAAGGWTCNESDIYLVHEIRILGGPILQNRRHKLQMQFDSVQKLYILTLTKLRDLSKYEVSVELQFHTIFYYSLQKSSEISVENSEKLTKSESSDLIYSKHISGVLSRVRRHNKQFQLDHVCTDMMVPISLALN
ncbi:Hypothetical_protein [Hexamita inflata]|uniref:Hypothetical_protein n=1 Tax=Hexamita inflata TaxID=28002 RepID=A0AA86NXY9_9EUKA|nr:Hypothetical protein HINF_LOCUS15763 [Hexamita inflata]